MTDITLVIPTRNEEEGIGECIDQAKEAFEEMGMDWEIILSDSSTDRTPEIGEEKGAKVVKPDKKGYGYAYRYAFEKAEGDLIAMGDGDTTYDFGDLPRLIQKMKDEDADMVMGSRLDGDIKPGSMPRLHKYIGNPLLTKFLNKFYGAGVSDAHSGMRVIRRDALDRLDLKTDGMEFASEMIMEAGAKNLKIVEEPIVYHKREGEATLNSFRDGWRHIKFMLINAPDYLFFWPGVILILFGLGAAGLSISSFRIAGTDLGSNSTILGAVVAMTGYQIINLSIFTRSISEPLKKDGEGLKELFYEKITPEKGMGAGAIVILLSTAYSLFLLNNWIKSRFTDVPTVQEGIIILVGLTVGVQTIFNSFFLSILTDQGEQNG